MKTRLLLPDEVYLCAEGGESFFAEGGMPGGFEPEAFKRTWGSLISSGVGFIIGVFDGATITGALGWILCPGMFNSKPIATEAFWYVLPQYRNGRAGLVLFDEFERQGARHGAKLLAMIHLEALQPDGLRKLYGRRGYRLIESHYVKELAA